MEGTKKEYDKGGMGAVIDYLMKVTQVEDVDKEELLKFAESIKDNPAKGFDILKNAAKNKDKK